MDLLNEEQKRMQKLAGIITEGDITLPIGIGGVSGKILGDAHPKIVSNNLAITPASSTGKGYAKIGYTLEMRTNENAKYYGLFLNSGSNKNEDDMTLGYRFSGMEKEMAFNMTKLLIKSVVEQIKSTLSNDVQIANKHTDQMGEVTEEELKRALLKLDNIISVQPKEV